MVDFMNLKACQGHNWGQSLPKHICRPRVTLQNFEQEQGLQNIVGAPFCPVYGAKWGTFMNAHFSEDKS